MQINVTSTLGNAKRYLASTDKQARFALALAMTKTAVDARAEIRQQLPKIIDRPTPYTLNSMYVRKATRARLEAEVGFKDNFQSAPGQSKHYLMALINGGDRRTKRFEGRLILTGKMNRGERLVPTRFADIDRFGNVSRGQITKILSQLKAAVVSGDFSNASDSKRSRKKRSFEEYFWSPGPGGVVTYMRNGKQVTAKAHLTRGVWMVRRTAFGNAVRPIFYAKDGTTYRKQFDMAGIVQRVIEKNFSKNFDESLATALRTAR